MILQTGKNKHRISIFFCEGFTLIEVLVSLVILSIGIILVLRAFETSLFALAETRNSLWANAVIKEKMAEIELITLRHDQNDLVTFSGGFSSLGYEGNIQIKPIKELLSTSNTLNEIVVTVWRRSVERHYSATTYIISDQKDR